MDLKETRVKLVKDARNILDKAESEKRGLTSDERAKYDSIMEEVDVLSKKINLESEFRNLEETVNAKPKVVETETRDNADVNNEYTKVFDSYLRRGIADLPNEEVRALNIGTGSQGGYLVPTTLNDTIINVLNEKIFMRKLATFIKTGNDKNIPVATDGEAYWTAEGASGTESDTVYANVLLSAYKAQALMKVSEELLQDSGFDLESYIINEYVRRIATLEEKAFVNGDGSGKPTGIINSGVVGVTTASNSAITADEIIDMYYSLATQYRGNAVWILGTDTIKAIRKLKDSNGNYIWQAGFSDRPDTLMGSPVYESSYVPSMGAGNKVAAFGDISKYYIAQRGRVAMQRLNELYAANGQIGFRGYERIDGKLVDSEAVKILQMSS